MTDTVLQAVRGVVSALRIIAGVLLILSVMNPDYLEPLWTTSKGKMIIGVSITMYAVGITVMRDMSNVEV